MRIDVKAAIILIATLLLGVVLGAVGRGALSRQRDVAVDNLRRPQGFVNHLEDVIAPHDSAQSAAIVPVLRTTAERNDTILRRANAALKAQLDSMRATLSPLLDDAQRQRLDQETARARPPEEMGRGRPPAGRAGPPPDDRGPPDGRRPPPDDSGGTGRRGPPPDRGGPPDGRRPPPPPRGGPPPDRGGPPGGQ